MKEITDESMTEIIKRLNKEDVSTWALDPAKIYLEGKFIIFEGSNAVDAERLLYAIMMVMSQPIADPEPKNLPKNEGPTQ